MWIRRAAALLATGALFAAGCGSDYGSSSKNAKSTSTPPAKKQSAPNGY